MRISSIVRVSAVLVASTVFVSPAAVASADAPTGGATTRATASKPTGVSLRPVDRKHYEVTGTPHCGLLDTTCQVYVGSVGGDFHWEGGTEQATFANWNYGETKTPQFWTYSCFYAICVNSAKVSSAPVTRPYPSVALDARVESQDSAGRSAVVSGVATGKASIRLNGREVARATDAGTGDWRATVTGLSVGVNTLTFSQYVDGQYRDQKSVTVTITDPVKPGQITGDAGTATLDRGTTTTVNASFTAQAAFSTPTGTLTLTAPQGTTFESGQDRLAGEYLSGSQWQYFDGASLVNGSRSSDGRTYTYALGARNWAIAKGQRFRFGLRVVTPVTGATERSEMRGRLVGTIPGGTFDTTATVSTTVRKLQFGATPSDVDVSAGTATLDGVAPPATTSIDVTWVRNGQTVTETVTPTKPGEWTAALTGLATGSNPVHLVAFVGKDRLAEADIDVRLDVAGLTAAATFPSDVTKAVVVAGKGQRGASIELRAGGAVIGSTTVDIDGTWSVEVAAPDRGGVLAVRVAQSFGGSVTGTVDLDIDYGRAVRILSPGDGFELSPVWPELRLAGDAEPGASVRITRSDAPAVELGRATAGLDGRWAVTTRPLEHRDQVLSVSAISKGANTTTAQLRIVAGRGRGPPVAPGAGGARRCTARTVTVPVGGRGPVSALRSLRTGQPGADVRRGRSTPASGQEHVRPGRA